MACFLSDTLLLTGSSLETFYLSFFPLHQSIRGRERCDLLLKFAHFFLEEGYSLKQSNAHGCRHHWHELKISPCLIPACWELRGDGFGHCHAAELPFWNYTSSSLHHVTAVLTNQSAGSAYPGSYPALFSDQFADEHTTSTKSRDCSVLSPLQHDLH